MSLCGRRNDRSSLENKEELGAALGSPHGFKPNLHSLPPSEFGVSPAISFYLKKGTSKEQKLWPFLSIMGKHLDKCKISALSVQLFITGSSLWLEAKAADVKATGSNVSRWGGSQTGATDVLQLSSLRGHRWIRISTHLARPSPPVSLAELHILEVFGLCACLFLIFFNFDWRKKRKEGEKEREKH